MQCIRFTRSDMTATCNKENIIHNFLNFQYNYKITLSSQRKAKIQLMQKCIIYDTRPGQHIGSSSTSIAQNFLKEPIHSFE